MTSSPSPRGNSLGGSFFPGNYFFGLLQDCLEAKPRPVLFSHPEQGWVAILPKEGQWYNHAKDLRVWCATPAHEFHRENLPEHLDLSTLRPMRLEDLLWQAAFHSSQSRLPEGHSLHDIVHLKHWPNLAHLPHTPDFVRLCALLSRRPHSLDESCRLLGVDENEARSFYGAALASGALQCIHRPSAPPPVTHFEPEPPQANQRSSTLLSLWRRLTGKH